MASRIATQLHNLLPKRCLERPFVCDGLPENCSVIVIGENPALHLGVNWWTFWKDDSGFNLQKFETKFQEMRDALGERRPTRDALDRLLNPLRHAGLGCLETNVYRNENIGGHNGGGNQVENDDVLQILLAELLQLSHFRAVISHGHVARDFMSGQSLPPHIQHFETVHFSRLGHNKIDAIVHKIRRHQ